jgi:hypothetical protein
MGDFTGRSGFPFEMYGLRASGHDRPETSGKKYPWIAKKSLKSKKYYDIVLSRDIL